MCRRIARRGRWAGISANSGHGTIDRVDAFLEYVSNQEIDDVNALFRILAQETAKLKPSL
jgi:hypothetical protein